MMRRHELKRGLHGLHLPIARDARGLTVSFGVFLLAGCGVAPAPVGFPAESTRPLAARDPAEAADVSSFDVKVEVLLAHTPPAIDERRNPFRFGSPAGGARSASGAESFAPVSRARNGTPPLQRAGETGINAPASDRLSEMRFIGLVEARNRPGRVAVLTDGDEVYHGLVNDIVRGRYRILTVTVTSVEFEDMVSGTRVTLRLSGS